jgi:hypothetical protein
MPSLFKVFGLFVALAVLLPVVLAAEPKKERLIPAGEMTGKLTKVDTSSRHFTLQVKQPTPVRSGRIVTTQLKDVTVELDGIEDMNVRLAQAPMVLDDKGNRRKMNAKELKDYKGPAGQPGYKGDLGDLKKDQTVTVKLGKSPKAGPNEKAKIMTIIIDDPVVK